MRLKGLEGLGTVIVAALILCVGARGQEMSTVAGTGDYGFSGDGGQAKNAMLDAIYAIASDAQGNLYIADSWNHRVRKMTPGGAISTIAGTGQSGASGDGGPAVSASLNCPRGLAVDGQGNIYIADSGNSKVRKIATNGTITTIAGTWPAGFSGDGGPASAAQLNLPRGLALDAQGNLYVADSMNFRIRKITPQGTISTIAGTGAYGRWGDGGKATEATVGLVQSLALDSAGNLYFTDVYANCVRKVSTAGIISTVAGSGLACSGGDCGGNGGAADAQFVFPRGLAVSGQGKIFLADSGNHRVRVVAVDGSISTLAGTGSAGFSGDGGPAQAAALNYPYALALDAAGNLLIGDVRNYRVRKVSLAPASESRLMFPFYMQDASCSTAFAVLNRSGEQASLQFTLYGVNGQPLATPTSSCTSKVEGNRQLPRMGYELFGLGAANSDRGWVDLKSNKPISAFFQYLGSNRIDGATAFTTTYQKLCFTRIIHSGSTSTYLSIANPSADPVQVSLSLLGPSGTLLKAPVLRTLQARGVLFGTVTELFGLAAVPDGYVIAQVTEGEGIIGFELIRFENAAVGLNAQPVSSRKRLYSAQYAESPDVFTNLRLVNVSNATRQLTITAINEQGQTAAGPVTIPLGAGQALERARVADLFPSFTAGTLVASLKVDLDAGGVVGDVLFGHPQLSYAAAMPLQDEPFTRAVFSHVANGMGYFTGAAFFNAGAASATVTMRVYRSDGQLTGTKQIPLGAGCRIARLLNEADFVAASAGQVGGYVIIESSQPLIAQELFALYDFSLMSAVPPAQY